MFISINVIGFCNIGNTYVTINKVLNTETNDISYHASIENDFAPPIIYKIDGSDGKIEKLFVKLESIGNTYSFNEKEGTYDMYACKYYDVFNAELDKSKNYITRRTIFNPINRAFKAGNNEINAGFDEVFDFYFRGVEMI